MNGRDRVALAMRLQKPERVPVMCQLAIGHYFLHTDIPNEDIWFDADGFSEALVTLARRYGFDGVLANLMPAPPEWRAWIDRIDEEPDGTRTLRWKKGGGCRIPADDNLHHFPDYQPPSFEDVDPAKLFYLDPHGPAAPSTPSTSALSPRRGPIVTSFPTTSSGPSTGSRTKPAASCPSTARCSAPSPSSWTCSATRPR